MGRERERGGGGKGGGGVGGGGGGGGWGVVSKTDGVREQEGSAASDLHHTVD